MSNTLFGTSYGFDESGKKLHAYVTDAGGRFIAPNAANIRACMAENGLLTGAGRLTEFINLAKFKDIREICLASLQINGGV